MDAYEFPPDKSRWLYDLRVSHVTDNRDMLFNFGLNYFHY